MGRLIFITILIFVLCSNIRAQEWGYEPPIGPSEWPSISPSYSECGEGTMQSPVDIITDTVVMSEEGTGLFLLHNDMMRNGTLVNDGHTVEFQADDPTNTNAPTIALVHNGDDPFFTGRTLGDRYHLNSLDFHWGSTDSQGSEHFINSEGTVGEVHFNYFNSEYTNFTTAAQQSDGLTIIALRLRVCANSDFNTVFGTDNEYLETLSNDESVSGINWRLSDLHECESIIVGVCNDKFYVYHGSLTIPPCYQSALWWVSAQSRCITRQQLDLLRMQRVSTDGAILVNNYRPLQDVDGRTIQQTGLNSASSLSQSLMINLLTLIMLFLVVLAL
ncbi:Alpha carbonic anhydrase 5 [Oopsacas minuta]|uniref:Alpha carbonic anhydrase 5 n=1 Tax=Oopsacas minuta TaxID=111878 RepID=A0AAV7JNS4_9METZ|nr:Alpha carbonic anhydrase 5 [Oopsacas minuta]